jgi:CubicO group peptidase (beta-lactamase class C family)
LRSISVVTCIASTVAVVQLTGATISKSTPGEVGLSTERLSRIGEAPSYDLVSTRRPITIQDLLTHTSGLVSGPIGYGEMARLAPSSLTDRLADVIPRLARVPLDFEPGARWAYGATAGFDTLLRIVEIASGQAADRFLRGRVFEPLGMRDTAFWTTAAARLVRRYDLMPKGFSMAKDQYGLASVCERIRFSTPWV